MAKNQDQNRQDANDAWEKAKEDIERHDREFEEKHGGGQK